MREVEVPNWLNGLPLAPEFHPTDTEFADPIAYISKIEKEASAFGICKVIPPLPKPAKKYVLANLNKSLLKCPELGDDVCSFLKLDNKDKGESRAVFTTRQQELGFSGKKAKGSAGGALQLPAAHKQVWQSGEIYTLEQFESKSKTFARSQLSTVKEASPEVIEALFWKAANEKPIYIEYANDVPGSGFGEPPEEPLRGFHNRRRRRRKRGTFCRNNRECSDFKEDQVVKLSNTVENNVELNASCAKFSVEISQASTSSLNMLSDQMSQGPRQRGSNSAGNEMEGTSGWKLSNSPWNLQVIARSPGSLTRFMPDDIPGVTSPMIYIGMLFSWFAWHVEDHELHSLNFLHTGSPKTWYSIPGDYAFTFEEVIRSKAYGGNIDRLAALTLLGEKTTLLSPEVVVASGIPCCRLVQNPGEFVVTFPRAYHIGFSHGFNCGEAANFGTPKWLTVAKGAAVRRAAMNHLPMLSHQQLLYLLTMSFISRVPRSLLPGVRSSRLRDRQKEERELLVKEAFVEDILNENKLLTTLLRKNSSYHAVLWDLESLPSTGKESDLCSSIDDGIITTPIKKVHSENDKKDLCSEMNLYVETMDDLYVGDDDMSSDFQVDSGTLPCVACGVLGFPFMSIIQPYEKAAPDAVTTDHHVVQGLEIRNTMESHFPSDLNSMAERSISGLGIHNKKLEDEMCSENPNRAYSNTESTHTKVKFRGEKGPLSDISTTVKDPPDLTEVKFDKRWITSSGYLRPRIFCLEHASQTEELLHSRGGAKVLVICHSDFQKVTAHAAAVAEQIGSPFRYNEIQLAISSQDDLKLINLAIDNEEQAECGEDWTTKLNINLRQCVKLGNKSSSKKVQHGLTLDGLFADTASHAGSLILNWHARKTRSKKKVNSTDQSKPPRSLLVQKDEVVEAKSDSNLAGKGGCLIQYSRKRFFKSKIGGSVTNRGKTEIEGKSSSELVLGSIQISQAQHENVKNVKGQTQYHTLQEILMRDEVCDSTKDDFQMQNEIKNIAEISSGQKDRCSETSADSRPIANNSMGCSKIGISMATEAKNDIGWQSDVHDNGARNYIVPQYDLPEQYELQHENVENIKGQIENHTLREMLMRDEVSGSTKYDFQLQNEFNNAAEKSSKQKDGCCSEDSAALLSVANGSITSIESSEIGISMMTETEIDSGGSCAEEPGMRSFDEQMEERCLHCANGNDREQQGAQTTSRSTENKSVPSGVCVMNESAPDSVTENLEAPKETCTTVEMDSNGEDCSLLNTNSHPRSTSKSSSRNRSKRKREVEFQAEEQFVINGFIKSPCERLRPRGGKDASRNEINLGRTEMLEEKSATKVKKPATGSSLVNRDKKQHKKGSHKCDIEGCKLSFQTKAELALHRRNKCPHDGCGKKFHSHSYAVLHLRVHEDDRPLKCSWKGCTMTFKWSWARTEHLRVHTGEKPYECKIEGCGLKFRFVSDFSRHRRKTGHYVDVPT